LTLLGVVGQETAREARPVWLGRPRDELIPLATVALGLALGALSLAIYIAAGYSKAMLWLWLGGLVIAAVGFGLRSTSWPHIAVADLACAAGAAVICAPLYLIALYRWPVQVNSDELAVMGAVRDYGHPHGADPFGPGNYLTRPALLFIVWARLGNLIGGIDLFHMRLLHAMVGLLTIAACFALFRLLLPRNWAFFASLLVGVNHSMFMISRLAMRENTAVLVLVVAFTLLLWGFRHRNELVLFLGGVVAGFGFYVYYPARITFPIWVAFLLALGLIYRKRFSTRQLLTVGAITTAGFVLVATPIVYSESQIPVAQKRQEGGQRSLMIFHEGRAEQQAWVFADSEWDGWKTNVRLGLETFNSKDVDHGWIYINNGHGFVDPVTGIVLWLGVGLVGVGLIRRRRDDPGALLMLGGFLLLYLSFALVVDKAPNYTRLLVTLPFVAYFVAEAVGWAAHRWRSVRFAPQTLVAGVLVAVVALNLSAAWDFIQKGRRDGDPIGSTVRYVSAHKKIPGERFYVASTESDPYYEWGSGWDRLERFAKPEQLPPLVDPRQLRTFQAVPPFALLMRRDAWMPVSADLARAYPRGRIRNVTPDGVRVVFEVPS
jgi:Dolichyl-phosphate-mannose-protein mannosyltransferase